MLGDSKSSTKTETPPSSQALQRRLVVDRKQCVYSDLPKRNQFGSDGSTLYKKSLQTKSLAASKSHEKVVLRNDMSNSSVATTSVDDTTKNKNVPQSYRRQSLHTVIQRESPLRRGAEKVMNKPISAFYLLFEDCFFIQVLMITFLFKDTK